MENNLTQIQEFINQWKERALKWHLENLYLYIEERKENDALSCHLHNVEKKYEESTRVYKEFLAYAKERFGTLIMDSATYGKERGRERIIKAIEREAISKEKNLIARVNKVVGTILESFDLHIGYDGSLNGGIIGESGICTINTIYAGGYNIQCLHYRVLVKKTA